MSEQRDNPRFGNNVPVIESSARHRLLVSLPRLTDANFSRTVVYLLEHNEDGAFGLVLNRPTDHPLSHALAMWSAHLAAPGVLFEGGPVQQDGFVGIARIDGTPDNESWAPIGNGLATIDLALPPDGLRDRLGVVRVFRGYAGWGPGQLDDELDLDAWLVAEPTDSDLFTGAPAALWRNVLARQPGRLAWLADFPDDILLN